MCLCMILCASSWACSVIFRGVRWEFPRNRKQRMPAWPFSSTQDQQILPASWLPGPLMASPFLFQLRAPRRFTQLNVLIVEPNSLGTIVTEWSKTFQAKGTIKYPELSCSEAWKLHQTPSPCIIEYLKAWDRSWAPKFRSSLPLAIVTNGTWRLMRSHTWVLDTRLETPRHDNDLV